MDKLIDPAFAAQAYRTNIQTGGRVSGGDTTDTQGEDGGVSFASFLKAKVGESIDTMRTGEEMAARAVTEEADLTDVVQAVTNAEVTLQTVVAVRDRMVSAYQEIMRMPI